ncbi:LD-carboxypeptidase [Chitinophaga sp. Cy-1792]|uniref:S66 peptidase family protein n=1 Tax=Chitinophaga sp. Cy-1792 TaxID=2608339 RepID=UPI00141FDB9C|nr:LD-carboxypeptidase [Chitinophaga sp. Cy-1792]NIG53303.1 LD-carboxypeptidase [Chitinophaga sp. Cy-1792]
MNRKHFLSSLLAAGAVIPGVNAIAGIPGTTGNQPVVPPYLKPGDTIGITCPAGYCPRPDLDASLRIIESWGFKVRIGSTVGLRDFTFGGTDQQRTADFQEMLDNPEIKAILCARGGYGSARLLDKLNYDKFVQHPKWIIGFSDITAFHCQVNSKLNTASLHSKMTNSFPDNFRTADPVVQDSITSIYNALTGKKMSYTGTTQMANRPGKATGIVVGGNLAVIQSMNGTQSELFTDGKILFLEEVSEYLYNIDRMLGTLERSGKLKNLAGLILGGFNYIRPDDPGEEFGRTVQSMVLDRVKNYSYPVCFDFPIGHQRNNYAIKCNMVHTLEVTTKAVTLTE